MNILMTNDDGIGSEGLMALAKILRSRGKHQVCVIAPEANRSGISHAISILGAPVKLVKLEDDTWSCSGYPADCVIAAILGALPQKPDLVLSGINRGANLGTDLLYSGTAGAARQASLMEVPAIALSLDGRGNYCWDMAASWSADHLEELFGYCTEGIFVNVNIPNSPGGPEGMAITWPAVRNYHDSLTVITAPDSSRWCFLTPGQETAEMKAGSDCEAVSRNLVSVSLVYNLPAVRDDSRFETQNCTGGA